MEVVHDVREALGEVGAAAFLLGGELIARWIARFLWGWRGGILLFPGGSGVLGGRDIV